MKSLETEKDCLLELIGASLFNTNPVIPEEVNWERLFELAKSQCIVPLISSYVPIDHRNEWTTLTYQSKAHLMKLIHEQDLLGKLFFDNGIPFVIIKGTAAAIYFPSPYLRTFGDIDCYISEKHLSSASSLLENHGYKYKSNDNRHFEFEKNGMDIELHSKFSCEHYNDIDNIVLMGLDNSVNYKFGNYSFWGLPTYENGLVILGHIMQHLKGSGIGLRQIIDWMMYVHNELDDLSWNEHFKSLAIESGLEKLAITVTYMCIKWLGLPDKITWCNSADEDVADQLLLRVLEDGNFGQERAPYENVNMFIKEEGLFKYLQKAGMENWILAQKYKVFRPFAWLYQAFRFVNQGFLGLLNGRKVFTKNKKIMSLEELWERLE